MTTDESILATARKGIPLKTQVIDCHCHLGEYSEVHIPRNNLDEMLKTMGDLGIDVACISSFASVGPDWKFGNDIVAKVIRRYPGRFIGYAVINPNYPDSIDNELSRCFDKLGMKAIKLHPVWHSYPINGPNYVPVFEYAEANKLTILSHTWGSYETLSTLAENYPHLNFIVAHAGGWDGRNISNPILIDYKILDAAKKYDNIYLDLAATLVYLGAVEHLVRKVGAEKILYGSDFPLHSPSYQLGRVVYARIDEREKREILGGNAGRPFRISV
jgi:hypothetical protein